MSTSEESNQANVSEYELGSLPQYDSGDLTELVRKLQQENPGATTSESLRLAIQSLSSRPNTGGLEQLAAVAGDPNLNKLTAVQSSEPFLEILEQPKSKGIRFRYKCEGRSAGSIPGESSTNEHKTFPSVRINNFKGPAAIVVVSCVTKDEQHNPHPHTLVGKECRKGVCTIKLKRSNVATFPNLGIQCVTKKEIKDSLKEREQIRVDPFGTGYFNNISKLHLNIVRLCFQAFLPDESGQYTRIVPPVVSQCIYDKKAVNDLVICRLSKQSGHAKGGDEVFMLCEKVNKDDIQVRFFEEVDEETIWESFADFSQSDVHRQFAIVFKTPPYKDQYISRPVEVHMQLFRPSDEGTSEQKTFQYIPNDPDPEGIERKRKRRVNFETFFKDSNNPNTPAFSLLTDNLKDSDATSASVREKIKAKASRGRKVSAMTLVSRPDLPMYTSPAPVPEPSDTYQTTDSPMMVSEVVVQTTGPVYADQVYGQVKSEGVAADDDVMLDDLPVTRMMKDDGLRVIQPEGDQLPSLPSLSNIPSMDITPETLKLMESVTMVETKLHTDGGGGGDATIAVGGGKTAK